MIEKKPFVPYTTTEERKKKVSWVYSIRINRKLLADIKEAQKVLQQPKMTTCIKQLVKLGLINVVHDTKTQAILTEVQNNNRRNDRLGITDPTLEINKL